MDLRGDASLHRREMEKGCERIGREKLRKEGEGQEKLEKGRAGAGGRGATVRQWVKGSRKKNSTQFCQFESSAVHILRLKSKDI